MMEVHFHHSVHGQMEGVEIEWGEVVQVWRDRKIRADRRGLLIDNRLACCPMRDIRLNGTRSSRALSDRDKKWWNYFAKT